MVSLFSSGHLTLALPRRLFCITIDLKETVLLYCGRAYYVPEQVGRLFFCRIESHSVPEYIVIKAEIGEAHSPFLRGAL
jgi:hypothetical protein